MTVKQIFAGAVGADTDGLAYLPAISRFTIVFDGGCDFVILDESYGG